MDLGVDIEHNISLSQGIKNYSKQELLGGNDKFMCETCNTKQVASKMIKLKKTPKILIVQLKRFKIDPLTYRHSKLTHRIPYPLELRV